MSEFIRVERQERIAIIHLERPKMNVLNRAMQEEIKAVALEVSSTDEVRAVVIYGGDRTFAAGAGAFPLFLFPQIFLLPFLSFRFLPDCIFPLSFFSSVFLLCLFPPSFIASACLYYFVPSFSL